MKLLFTVLVLSVFSLSYSSAKQFDGDELEEAIEYAKEKNKPLGILYGG